MLFSDQFRLTRTPDDRWFDPVLSLDTLLFIDPFLIYANEQDEFVGSHTEIIRFFECVFRLIADAKGDTESLSYRRALGCLRFPEVEELCLGYTAGGTRGAGSGHSIAREMAAAIWEAIQAGVTNIDHFEKIAILREGIGPDRVSDIVAALLRRRLAAYSRGICARHGVPCIPCRFIRGAFDLGEMRWQVLETELPLNPSNGKTILLVPAGYLRELPTINVDGFRDYCKEFEAETLRAELNADILSKVPKRDIVALARKHPELLDTYVHAVEQSVPQPYDFVTDKKGVVSWYRPTKAFCEANPLHAEVATAEQIKALVSAAVASFKDFIELHEGWRWLWRSDGTARDESAAQNLLLGVIKHYCRAAGVRVSPEQKIGRAPAVFSRGNASVRLLVELKLVRNGKHWSGLARTQPRHDKAEKAAGGNVVILALTDDESMRATPLSTLVAQLKPEYGLSCVTVDGSPFEESRGAAPETPTADQVVVIAAAAEPTAPHRVVIQFIAGDRGGGPRAQLQIPREEKGIRDAVTLGRFREAFDFAPSLYAAGINDVVACRHHQPAIVHFVGHGDERHLVLVRDRDLLVDMTPLDPMQAETLFGNFPARVRLVVFNTCRSLELARHLTARGVVDMALGVEGLIADSHAVGFATAFYRQLSDGETVRRAFDLARLHLGTADEAARPQLFVAGGVDPAGVVFGA